MWVVGCAVEAELEDAHAREAEVVPEPPHPLGYEAQVLGDDGELGAEGRPDGGEDLLASWAQLLEADVRIPAFLARSVARVILERRALDWAGLVQDFEWEKGYCPLCGSPPNISKHLEGTGQRWRHCPECNHEWRFRRVVCPCCENDDQKTMSYFTIDEKEQESAFGCEMCKSYLVTVLKVSGTAEFDPDIAALSLSHIDIIMQEKDNQAIEGSFSIDNHVSIEELFKEYED